MAKDCQAIQEFLTEVSGEVNRLDEAGRSHLEVCPGCREVAAAELALGRIFVDAVPPADPSVEQGVRAALRPVRIRRRIVALLPVAASVLVAMLGAVMVGGVPGGGLFALLPLWSVQGWMALAAGASDWSAAVATGARAAGAIVDPSVLAGAALVSLLSLGVVVVAALRWRRISPWRGDG